MAKQTAKNIVKNLIKKGHIEVIEVGDDFVNDNELFIPISDLVERKTKIEKEDNLLRTTYEEHNKFQAQLNLINKLIGVRKCIGCGFKEAEHLIYWSREPKQTSPVGIRCEIFKELYREED